MINITPVIPFIAMFGTFSFSIKYKQKLYQCNNLTLIMLEKCISMCSICEKSPYISYTLLFCVVLNLRYALDDVF